MGDEGLRALGLLSSPANVQGLVPKPSVAPASRRNLDDVDADDTIVVERVSAQEEERRYFAALGTCDDLFGELPAPVSEPWSVADAEAEAGRAAARNRHY